MKKKVLIADDDQGIQEVFKIIFERAGYETIILGDGEPFYNSDFEIPDIYLLDKQLGKMDGLDICRHLKSNSRSQNIPVIIVSATPDLMDIALTAGADGYIEKPFKMKELLDLVAENLKE